MNDVISLVKSQQSFFLPAVSDDRISWEKESQFAIQAFQKNDYLAKLALNNPTSAQNAIINVAAIGITLNPAARLAYLVPRNGEVHLDISYMGLIHLAVQAGSVRWAQAEIVYSNDTFRRVGIGKAPLHEYNYFGDRGQALGAYCVVKTFDGDFLTETMNAQEILDIRDRSPAYRAFLSKKKPCPWVTDEMEMWRKTVVKRGSKYWPKSERLSKAIDYLDNTGEGIELEPVMPHTPEKEVKAIEQKSAEQFEAEINSLCEQMQNAESYLQLKIIFQDAFKKTKGHQLQKDVQIAYNTKKESFNV